MLSRGQQTTFEIIKDYILEREISPTISEIMATQGIQSRSTVQRNLKALQEANYIRLLPDRRRNIELVQENEWGIPLIGRIAAGQPIEALPQPDVIDLPLLLTGENRYMLEVKGDSMLGDNICDGDWVLCESTSTVASGEIAVVLVEQEAATLKRVHHDRATGMISLIPSNPTYIPEEYPASHITIQGRYLGLLRLGNLR
jgi:repressor LexA